MPSVPSQSSPAEDEPAAETPAVPSTAPSGDAATGAPATPVGAGQQAKRFGYLGPEGTFTEAALLTLPAARRAELVPMPSVPTTLDAVRREEVDAGMVPLENSVEGSVSVTLDELATGEPLLVTGEVLLPVSFALLVRPGTTLDGVRTVASHPHAHPQVRRWLAGNLQDADWHAAASNAEAARLVAEGRYDAALAGRFAAERYGLTALADGIHDVEGAVTRFILVARPGRPVPRTGCDRTSLVVFMGEDHPGGLLEILQEFAIRGVNLTRIESRPTGSGLGSYHFSIDCEGHVEDARIGETLMGLRRVCADVRFLGSYPRADGAVPPRPADEAEAVFEDAVAWLERIRREGR